MLLGPEPELVAQIDRPYLRLGAGRTLRRLLSYALFEGRPATTRGQWFNPVVFAWLRVLAAIPGRPTVDRPLFITGLGRSGTTILGMVLSVHADAGFLNEPKAMWHLIDPRQDVNGNYGSSRPRYRLQADDVDADMRQRAHRLFGRYLQGVGARRVVDKYPELIFRIEYVRALFPDARFVFIYRNGIDACQSIVKWSERLGRETNHGLEDWWGRNDCKWHTLWQELVLGDPAYADLAALPADALDHANRAAVEWVVTMREGMAQCQRHPDRILKLRYEDLLAEPSGQLERLLAHAELRDDGDVLRYAEGRLHENPAKLLPTLLPPVRRWFDRTMSELGYPTEP